MPELVTKDDLQAGDLLLSLGEGRLSEAIRALDGGDYSHAALWTGKGVIESTLPRVIEHELVSSLAEHPRQYVDAFRFRDSFDAQGVIEAARVFLDRPYSKGDLLLGALVIATSTLLPKDDWRLQFLVEACELNRFLGMTRKNAEELVTCTQLVVRAFDAAGVPIGIRPHGGGKFDAKKLLAGVAEISSEIQIKQVDQDDPAKAPPDLDNEEWQEFKARVRARYRDISDSSSPPIERPSFRPTSTAALDEQIRIVVRDKFHELTGTDPSISFAPSTDARPHAFGLIDTLRIAKDRIFKAGRDWAANLVTPRFLQTSPDFRRLGRLDLTGLKSVGLS